MEKRIYEKSRIMVFFSVLTILLSGCDKEDNQIEYFGHNEFVRLLIVPDIQNYTNSASRYKYLDAITSFYQSNVSSFSACFQVGDITSRNYVEQYDAAYEHFFSKFPVGNEPYFCLGNHDYGKNGGTEVRESNIPSYIRARANITMEGSEYDNYVRYLQAGNTRYAVLVLEMSTRNEVLDWANEVVQKHHDVPFIILTHIFTNKYGQIHDETDPNVYHDGSQKSYKMGGTDYLNDSREIFDKLIYKNANIIMVVCGHTFLPDYIGVISRSNITGDEVYIVTVNYQNYDNGGDGFVGILEFMGDGQYNIKSYNTFEGRYGPVDISFGRSESN